MYPVALSFKPQGKGDESITHSAEVRYVPAGFRRRWVIQGCKLTFPTHIWRRTENLFSWSDRRWHSLLYRPNKRNQTIQGGRVPDEEYTFWISPFDSVCRFPWSRQPYLRFWYHRKEEAVWLGRDDSTVQQHEGLDIYLMYRAYFFSVSRMALSARCQKSSTILSSSKSMPSLRYD